MLALRLITEAPTQWLDYGSLGDPVAVATWRLDDAEERRAWTCSPCDPQNFATGLRARSSVHAPSLVREVDLAAEQVDAIEVAASGPRRGWRTRGQLQLFWADSHLAFTEQRSQRIEALQEPGAYAVTYTFTLADHPGWTGRIRRLRLDPTTAAAETVEVLRVRALGHRPSAERLAAVVQQAWKVDLGCESRPARALPPGHPLSVGLIVPPRGRLVFGYGAPAGVRTPVDFIVTAETVGGTTRLWEGRTKPDPEEPPAWRDVSVDLGPLAGQRVKLSMEARPRSDQSPAHGLPVVSGPEIWTWRQGSAPPSVLLVSLDTLRADRLSAYGYRRRTSPRLDGWARNGVVFEDAVAAAPWTLPSHVSMLTGLYPHRHGVNYEIAAPPSLRMLAEMLRDAGYATAAVTGGGFLAPAFGLDQGFDRFAYWPRHSGNDEPEMRTGVDRALALLSAVGGRPFFLLFHTYAVHAPYRARAPYFDRLTAGRPPPPTSLFFFSREQPPPPGEGGPVVMHFERQDGGAEAAPADANDIATINDLYDSGVAYADEELDRLLTGMKRLGLLDRTVVVITSDHGEALGERGLADHAYLYDFNLKVPLVLVLPAGHGRRVASQVSLVDVAPTILDFAGVPPVEGLDGRSLRGLAEGRAEAGRRVAWSYGAAHNAGMAVRISGRTKYILSNTAFWPGHGREELYVLGADPAESRNLARVAPETPALRQEVLQALTASWSGLGVRFTNQGPRTLRGRLSAPFLHEARVKAIGLTWPALRWRQEGEVEFEMRPGREFEVMLEGASEGQLVVTLGAGSARQRFALPVRDAEGPQRLILQGARWTRAGTGSPAAEAEIVIRWRGAGQTMHVRPSVTDPQVREALRALGYVQ